MSTRPNPEAVLGHLKDFQRSTVDYVFQRMYLDTHPTNRFLVADEVGLGKTLVARGLVAKVVDHLWDVKERIDVVYICSNADIARQNINRLSVDPDNHFALASRITLLPLKLHDLQARRLNFVSFTPGTSFDLKDNLGIAQERALLYLMLKEVWNLKGAAPLNLLQGDVKVANRFRDRVDYLKRTKSIDEGLVATYAHRINEHMAIEQREGKVDIRERFDEACLRFARTRKVVRRDRDRDKIVGELRDLLATACLEALEPDLIILDEFQRFRHLLRGEGPAGELAKDLFEYQDEDNDAVRVLLLSATPYKMYTSGGDDEDHYSDFVSTLRFLQEDAEATDKFTALLRSYRMQLLGLAGGERTDGLVAIRDEIESELRKVIARTERLAASPDRNGMLVTVDDASVDLAPQDIQAYVATQRIARHLGQGDTIEYWKSAPYLVNFMEDYALKKAFREAVESDEGAELASEVVAGPEAVLNWSHIETYRETDPRNARLRRLTTDMIDNGQWRLMWIPPSLPYYALGEPFSSVPPFTKRLIFSSWRVVPRVIATLLSYEAERRMISSFEKNPINTPDERSKRTSRALLRPAMNEQGNPGSLSLFTLLYPSVSLARACDPLRLAEGEVNLELTSVRNRVVEQCESLLGRLDVRESTQGPPDEAWYWAAPILLDLEAAPNSTRRWLVSDDFALHGAESDDAADAGKTWAAHVEHVRLLIGSRRLGPMPEGLADVLADVALGSPAVIALRSLSRLDDEAAGSSPHLRKAATRIGWAFRSLFNLPEVTAMIRGGNASEPYWRRVLEYCTAGCLQSVMDEYVHVLVEALGLIDAPFEDTLGAVADAVSGAVSLRTTRLGVDAIEASGGEIARNPRTMRARFAMRFGEERAETGDEATPADQVRDAFNSPFWPLVLATTSVGQEGLDFHTYCHAVVHWNLPSNPVDLEQREGRVHRYKGHAVRKNLAREHSSAMLLGEIRDPWERGFRHAVRERSPGANDLAPFWVFPVSEGAMIERHVPSLPLSREVDRLASLRKSLTVYRMVFGQPRQEDLLDFLLAYVDEPQLETLLERLRIDLSPPVIEPA